MKKIYFFCTAVAIAVFFRSANLKAQSGFKSYFVGHSLVNLDMPFQLSESRKSSGATDYTYRNHINNGTAIKANWLTTNFNPNPIWDATLGSDVEHGTNHLTALPTGGFDAIVLTEALPLLAQNADTTVKYMNHFFDLAIEHNPEIKTYIYQTWEFVPSSGTDFAAWRTEISSLQDDWESFADRLSDSTGQTCYIVPGGMALAALYDTLQLHSVGTITNISQMFSDDVHLSHMGNYLIAMVHYATLFGESPENLPFVKAGPYTSAYTITDNETRLAIQKIAWAVVCNYSSRTGINCVITNTVRKQENTTAFNLFPNPSSDYLYVETNTVSEVKILNMQCNTVMTVLVGPGESINVSGLSKGIYVVLREDGRGERFVKQ